MSTIQTPSPSRPRPLAATTPVRLRLRRLHLLLGIFFAPSILFFAITGSYQLYGLHEPARDGSYQPPEALEKLAQVHIHQRYALRPKRTPPAPTAAPSAETTAAAAAARPSPGSGSAMQVRKLFFLAVAVGLALTSLLGIWMALTQSRERAANWAALITGMLLPVLLMLG